MGPNIEQLDRIEYFTDLALSYGNVSNTFWHFHVIIAAAALGWAISSRNWKSGLPPFSSTLFAVGFLIFSLINLYCIGILYDRMNDAIHVAAELWKLTPVEPPMGSVLEEIGAEHWPTREQAGYLLGNFFSEGRFYVFLIDACAAIIAGVLLSPLGRKPGA